jgi:prepilin-type N-terminal cleavage/methylation domain-containing protein
VKRKNRKAFSLIEVIVALAIFSIAAVTLTISMANGLLCRRNVANRNAHHLEYTLAAHIIQNSASIDDAIRISSLTLPDGKVTSLAIAITPTDQEDLFFLEITMDGIQYKSLIANRNWQ